MSSSATTSSLQVRRIRSRLLGSRAFALGVLLLLALGTNYWSAAGHTLFEELLFILGLGLAALGFLGRLWCFSYIAGRKKMFLVTTGPYSLCRHPLYFFSLLAGLGLGLCTETLTIPALVGLGFATYYPAAIATEERFLRERFPDYRDYERRVPAFLPRGWASCVEAEEIIIKARAFRREIFSSGFFVLLLGVVELLEALHGTGVLRTYFHIP